MEKKDPKNYCKVAISLIEKFGRNFQYDAFLKLSETKMVRISSDDEHALDQILYYYYKKGVEYIYVTPSDYTHFIQMTKAGLSNKFFNPETTVEEKVDILDKGHQMLKESFTHLGVNDDAIEMAQEIADNSVKLIHRTPNLFTFLKNFQSKCSSEFMINIMIGYTSTCMIDTFEWKSDAIKEKANVAALIRDITLTPEDFKLMLEAHNDPANLPLHIIEHPTKVAGMLSTESKQWVSKETISIIEQHHEKPDGTGYPKGHDHKRISLLSAIHIVASRFIELMFENQFDYKKAKFIIDTLHLEYSKGTFLKATKALCQMLGI